MVSLYPSINGKSLIVSAFTLLLYFTFPSLLIGQPCNDVSTLNCSDVELSLPISLTFDGSQGGMTDGAATATGFTMVLPPSARLTVYGTPFDAAVPGYEPSKLSVSGGNLTVTSTKGIFLANLLAHRIVRKPTPRSMHWG
ncbi:MAG: hypothetical protein HRU41_38635 [Saprospiraceae bacterium]|nr:hypothetical protein [Saprospiraceae bacterium]